MSDEFIICYHCGAKNASSSFACYACAKALPQRSSVVQDEPKKENETIECEISVCDICRAIGRDRDSMGIACLGCKHNPNYSRDIGCGCVFIILLVLVSSLFRAFPPMG